MEERQLEFNKDSKTEFKLHQRVWKTVGKFTLHAGFMKVTEPNKDPNRNKSVPDSF